jgi:hypothetical protein
MARISSQRVAALQKLRQKEPEIPPPPIELEPAPQTPEVAAHLRKHERLSEAPTVKINVPWETLDILEAQRWYAVVRAEFERAGTILNARRCAENLDSFVCFMAGEEGACKPGIVHKGRPIGIDYAHKNPKTGLLEPAMICSERCWVLYQAKMIAERRERELQRAQS